MARSIRIFLGMLMVACPGPMMSQIAPLETDRPDQTESPAIVPAGWLQIEAGAVREHVLEGHYNNTLPATLTKLGLAPWAECRVIAEREQAAADLQPRNRGEWLPVEVGAKVKLLNEERLLPRTALIAHAGLPGTGDEGARPRTASGNFRFTMQHSLSDRFSLGYNVGAEWDGDRPTTTGIYTLSVGARLSEQWSSFAEAYGYFSDVDEPDHRFDAGVTRLIGQHVQLDASAGHTVGNDQWFVSAGISFRFALWSRVDGGGPAP